jgi:hypothetical protein
MKQMYRFLKYYKLTTSSEVNKDTKKLLSFRVVAEARV